MFMLCRLVAAILMASFVLGGCATTSTSESSPTQVTSSDSILRLVEMDSSMWVEDIANLLDGPDLLTGATAYVISRAGSACGVMDLGVFAPDAEVESAAQWWMQQLSVFQRAWWVDEPTTRILFTEDASAPCAKMAADFLGIDLGLSDNGASEVNETIVNVFEWADLGGDPSKVDYAADGCGESVLSDREDAVRCYGEKYIYDPCFVSDGGAVCPDSPWGDIYTWVEVEGDGPVGISVRASGDPWGIELLDGTRCQLLGGATTSRKGLRYNYDCDSGILLWGSPDKRGVWGINASDGLRSPLYRVQIRKAVY